MLVRYSSSIGAGAVVTAALIWGMQHLIGGGEAPRPIERPPQIVFSPRVEPPPQPVRPPLPPPPPSQTRPALIQNAFDIGDPTTSPAVPIGPVTPPGPASPPGRPGGRPGPWAADAGPMLVAQVKPGYSYAALARELEGYVVVEFTVTSKGTVDDVRIVESTHREFERAAATAVAKARYRPRIIDGRAVDTPGQRTRIAFELED